MKKLDEIKNIYFFKDSKISILQDEFLVIKFNRYAYQNFLRKPSYYFSKEKIDEYYKYIFISPDFYSVSQEEIPLIEQMDIYDLFRGIKHSKSNFWLNRFNNFKNRFYEMYNRIKNNKKIKELINYDYENIFVKDTKETGIVDINAYISKLLPRLVWIDEEENVYTKEDVYFDGTKYYDKATKSKPLNIIEHRKLPESKKIFDNDYYTDNKKIWKNIVVKKTPKNKVNIIITFNFSAYVNSQNFIYTTLLLKFLIDSLIKKGYSVSILHTISSYFNYDIINNKEKDIGFIALFDVPINNKIKDEDIYYYAYEPLSFRFRDFVLIDVMYENIYNFVPSSLGYPVFNKEIWQRFSSLPKIYTGFQEKVIYDSSDISIYFPSIFSEEELVNQLELLNNKIENMNMIINYAINNNTRYSEIVSKLVSDGALNEELNNRVLSGEDFLALV